MKLPDVRRLHRRARRLALRTQAVAYRTIVVPLLEREETEHALDLGLLPIAARESCLWPRPSSSASCR